MDVYPRKFYFVNGLGIFVEDRNLGDSQNWLKPRYDVNTIQRQIEYFMQNGRKLSIIFKDEDCICHLR